MRRREEQVDRTKNVGGKKEKKGKKIKWINKTYIRRGIPTVELLDDLIEDAYVQRGGEVQDLFHSYSKRERERERE